jgi:hypothetical protein
MMLGVSGRVGFAAVDGSLGVDPELGASLEEDERAWSDVGELADGVSGALGVADGAGALPVDEEGAADVEERPSNESLAAAAEVAPVVEPTSAPATGTTPTAVAAINPSAAPKSAARLARSRIVAPRCVVATRRSK